MIVERLSAVEAKLDLLLAVERHRDDMPYNITNLPRAIRLSGVPHCGRPLTIDKEYRGLASGWVCAFYFPSQDFDGPPVLRFLENNRSLLSETWGETVADTVIAEAAELADPEAQWCNRQQSSCEALGLPPVHETVVRAALELCIRASFPNTRYRGGRLFMHFDASAELSEVLRLFDGVYDLVGVPKETDFFRPVILPHDQGVVDFILAASERWRFDDVQKSLERTREKQQEIFFRKGLHPRLGPGNVRSGLCRGHGTQFVKEATTLVFFPRYPWELPWIAWDPPWDPMSSRGEKELNVFFSLFCIHGIHGISLLSVPTILKLYSFFASRCIQGLAI